MAKRCCLTCGSLMKKRDAFCSECGKPSPAVSSSPRGRRGAAVKSATPAAIRAAHYWAEARAEADPHQREILRSMAADIMKGGGAA